MGIARIVREAYPDKEDPTWVWVDLAPEKALPAPVTLWQLKAHPALSKLSLLRQSRLSVCPIRPEEWEAILSIR